MDTNVLYYGDNLDVLRRHVPDASVDLIYLDPPFNSNRSYNILFKESGGEGSGAQIEAFEDTWHWGHAAQAAYEEVMTGPHQPVARMLRSMVEGLGHNDVTAYLSMMAIRLIELHRVLQDTGSIYLHCDPTAGAYLRVLMDAVFEARNFRNEVTWKRTNVHSDSKRWSDVSDRLLYYVKDSRAAYTWNEPWGEHDAGYVESKYRNDDGDGRGPYQLDNMTSPNPRPNMMYEWKGFPSPPLGWRYSKETMSRLDAEGRIYYPKTTAQRPRLKRYLAEQRGQLLTDVWTDIWPINSQAKERLGYATQKPLALLERVITASSNPGDIVLDPFCGCGTAVHAAQKLGREWIGIDVTHLAISLIRRRMEDAFPGLNVDVIGEPVDLGGVKELAAKDKYQFQWWALDRIGAQPVAGKKKGSDKGIDGVIPFVADRDGGFKRVMVSVKGGETVGVQAVRDLRGVMEREGEPIGVLLTLVKPTKDMTTEAISAGHYENELWQKQYPRLQILTVQEVLAGKLPQMPPQRSPFAEAPVEKERSEQGRMV
jgi:site-specific DNA-methyltransferase (adenine-specific)